MFIYVHIQMYVRVEASIYFCADTVYVLHPQSWLHSRCMYWHKPVLIFTVIYVFEPFLSVPAYVWIELQCVLVALQLNQHAPWCMMKRPVCLPPPNSWRPKAISDVYRRLISSGDRELQSIWSEQDISSLKKELATKKKFCSQHNTRVLRKNFLYVNLERKSNLSIFFTTQPA
jgi:hypothetical protein